MATAVVLTGRALAGLAGIAAVLLAPPGAVPAPGGLALGAAVLVLASRGVRGPVGRAAPPGAFRQGLGAAAVLVALALAAAAVAALRVQARLDGRLDPALEGRPLRVEVKLDSLPQATAAGWRFEASTLTAHDDAGRSLPLPRRLALHWTRWPGDPEPPRLRAGERWALTVVLARPHGLANPGGHDRELAALARDLGAQGAVRPRAGSPPERLEAAGPGLAPLREALRSRLQRALLGPEGDRPQFVSAVALEPAAPRPREVEAGVLAALLLGDQAALDEEVWALYRDTGVAHLMAISGVHVTLWAALASAALAAVWRRLPVASWGWPAARVGAWGGLLAAAGYALLAGWGVPAQRTLAMLGLWVLLGSLGLRWPWPTTLTVAALGVALAEPWALHQAGFWLSFGAVGLLMAHDARPRYRPPEAGRPGPEATPAASPGRRAAAALATWVAGGLRAQVAIAVGLTPLSLLLFHQVSGVGFLANLLAIPWVTGVVLPLTLIGVVFPPAWSAAAWAVDGLNTALAAALAAAGGPSAALAVWDAAAIAPGWAALALLGGALAVLPLPAPARGLGLLAMLPALAPPPSGPAPGRFSLLAPDVGQGSAVLLRTARHALLFDAGPRQGPGRDAGHAVLRPLLRAEGLRRLDALVLSHGDADHVGGALSLMETGPVAVLHSSLPEDDPLRAHAVRLGLPHRACRAGEGWTWDGVHFEWLHPDAERLADPDASRNARSCVLRVRAAGPGPGPDSVLLTGDIGRAEELRLAAVGAPGPPDPARREALAAEVLVLGHHGSAGSSIEPFLDAVAPRWALAQTGHRNRFGHPAAVVRARLAARGIPLVESARCGAWRYDAAGPRCWRSERARAWWDRPVDPGAPASGLPARAAPAPAARPGVQTPTSAPDAAPDPEAAADPDPGPGERPAPGREIQARPPA